MVIKPVDSHFSQVCEKHLDAAVKNKKTINFHKLNMLVIICEQDLINDRQFLHVKKFDDRNDSIRLTGELSFVNLDGIFVVVEVPSSLRSIMLF